jgi:hypothetical protein
MEKVDLLDNSVGIEIYADGNVGFDCLVGIGGVGMGCRNVSWDDLFIRDCTCWKRDHIYAGAVR